MPTKAKIKAVVVKAAKSKVVPKHIPVAPKPFQLNSEGSIASGSHWYPDEYDEDGVGFESANENDNCCAILEIGEFYNNDSDQWSHPYGKNYKAAVVHIAKDFLKYLKTGKNLHGTFAKYPTEKFFGEQIIVDAMIATGKAHLIKMKSTDGKRDILSVTLVK